MQLLDALGRTVATATTDAAGTACSSAEINDVATASLLENYLDEAEGRIWFLAETTHSEEVPAA